MFTPRVPLLTEYPPGSSWAKNPWTLLLSSQPTKRYGQSWTAAYFTNLIKLKQSFITQSTYLLYQTSSHFLRSHACQPYSIFNLTNYNQCYSGNGSAAGAFFKKISKKVLQNGSSATLKLSTVQESLVRCAEHSHIATAFETILALFPGFATSVPILGNQHLNRKLEILANLLL